MTNCRNDTALTALRQKKWNVASAVPAAPSETRSFIKILPDKDDQTGPKGQDSEGAG